MENKEYYLVVVEEDYCETYHSLHTTYEGALKEFYMHVGRNFCDVIETKNDFLKADEQDKDDYMNYLLEQIKTSTYKIEDDMNYLFFEDAEFYIKKITLKED